MSEVRVIALGNPDAADDGAALRAAQRLAGVEVVAAGRPGAGLLDLLASPVPTVLVDVVRSGGAPGKILEVPLLELPVRVRALPQYSSHGFGPAEAIELGQALGRPLPPGIFVGIEGTEFRVGAPPSAAVEAAIDELVRAIEDAVTRLGGRPCTRAG